MAYGFIGPAVKKFLIRRGYSVSRRTAIERAHERSYWHQWFSRDPALFAAVYAKNRETLKAIPNWISADAMSRSLWRYGVPIQLTSPMAGSVGRIPLNEIESEVTSPDLLAFIAKLCLPKLSYLEIGVSVGKTLLQMNYQVFGAAFVAIDVEEINPVIRQHFDTCEEFWRAESPYPVETLSNGLVSKTATVQRLKSQRSGNTLEYVSADQFNDDTWARLKGHRFNLIFSDGVHSPDALRAELRFLIKHDLIDRDRLIMFWDDLAHPQMQAAFVHNAKTLCRMFNRGDDAFALYQLRGSYCDYDSEGRSMTRPMGIFCSLA
jgi:hypothetical protein